MAGKKENLKALFTNTRSRVIIIFTAVVLLVAVIIGVLRFTSVSVDVTGRETARVTGPGQIASVPGAIDPTAQYAALQAQQNIEKAQEAEKKGGSAIPTIIRAQEFGEGVQPIGAQEGKAGVGFSTLAREAAVGPQKEAWLNNLKNSNCSKSAMDSAITEGATIQVLKEACTCAQLKENGIELDDLEEVCTCKELRAIGFNAKQLKDAGFSASRLRACGFDACELQNAGFTAQQLRDAGFSKGELKGAGFPTEEIEKTGLPEGVTEDDIRNAGCGEEALRALREKGVSAAEIRRISGCTAAQMKAAGYTAEELKDAGFTPQQLRDAGFTAQQLRDGGFSAQDLKDAGFSNDDLRNAGFSPGEIAETTDLPTGVTEEDIRNAGCTEAGLRRLRAAGVSAAEIRRISGCTAEQLRAAGFTAEELKAAGFTPDQIRKAGYSADALQRAGIAPLDQEVAALPGVKTPDPAASAVTTVPTGTQPPTGPAADEAVANQQQLQQIMERQQQQMTEQQFQQKLQQRQSRMLSAANEALQRWRIIPTQVYVAGTPPKPESDVTPAPGTAPGIQPGTPGTSPGNGAAAQKAIIKTGDVMFAVLDTAVNTDEPGPILATLVSGKYKGAKLIGSFTLPNNADKMVINFNTMSVPGAPRTTGISAYAIDPNTARTALASYTNHHYLSRYGSLFAATFLEGFGNAFQSANTTITIGGQGDAENTTIQSGIGRSVLENAVIGLATLGKAWGQVAQQNVNRQPTVYLCAGTGIGILFTQDVTSI